MRKLRSGLAIAAAAMLLLSSLVAAKATEAGWALLREGGQIVLIRHAFSPGSGDARGFSIDDCSTQRNLSERGRQQAEKMGALFAARAGRIERVVSSRYCRCLETATVAFEDNKIEVLGRAGPTAAGRHRGEDGQRCRHQADRRLWRGRQPDPRHPSGKHRRAHRRFAARGRGGDRAPRRTIAAGSWPSRLLKCLPVAVHDAAG